jgi:pyruvate dehydrogenase E1 component alpha subunit
MEKWGGVNGRSRQWTAIPNCSIPAGMGKRASINTQKAASADGLTLYRTVFLIRRVEESLKALFAEGLVPGFIHLSIGQEAVAAGVISALLPEDTVASTHRGHGHAIAKGIALQGFFAELMGRRDGVCAGRGGTMHVADLERGFLGANGIVAAGLPLALGSALAHRTLGRSAIAVTFFGDGALAEGVVHESFNLAALWKLPVLFVCENNLWGEFQPTSGQLAFALSDLAKAYCLPYRSVDGNDVAAVAEAARASVAAVRTNGPMVLECMTVRVGGHYEGDPQRGRDPAEIAALAERDPVMIARGQALAVGITAADIVTLETAIEAEIAAAIAFARASPEPTLADSLTHAYSPAA